jgi:uncharacterized protein
MVDSMRRFQNKTTISTFIAFCALFSVFLCDKSLANEHKARPSFDCGSIISITQTVICESPTLSALDFELSTFIDGLRQLLTRTQYLVEARTFVAKRDQCVDNIDCIEKVYESRIWRVRSRVGDVSPIEGSWVNDTYANINIVKLGSTYRLNGFSPESIERYCSDGQDATIWRSGHFDIWDMKKDGFTYSWNNECEWTFLISDEQLAISASRGCIETDELFLGSYRKGEPSDLEYVCFDR